MRRSLEKREFRLLKESQINGCSNEGSEKFAANRKNSTIKKMKIITDYTLMKYLSFFLFLMFSCFSANAQSGAGELPRQGFMGAQVAPVPEELRSQLKLPANEGIIVMRADAGSSLKKLGLKSVTLYSKSMRQMLTRHRISLI